MTTTTTIAPAALVEAAPRVPLPYGLFSTFVFRGNSDRWEAGVQFETVGCGNVLGGIGAWLGCDPDDPSTIGLPKSLDANGTDLGEASPFVVYGHYTCNPVGTPDFQERANAVLLAREEARVEQAIWSGDLGNTPNLHDAAGLTMNGAPQSLAAGLAYLEFEIARGYGSLGVIHMTRGMALVALADNLLEVRGGRLMTALGTPVAAGAGYSGEGPEGSDPTGGGQSWAFATPAIFGYRSEVFTSSARPGDLLDRAQNVMTAIAERSYLLGWNENCGAAAVLLDLAL